MTATDPFDAAHEQLRPVLAAHGFRLAGIERGKGRTASHFAEYLRRDRRVRLVWEGEARALWVESAPQEGMQLVGRWTDIEWSLAGTPLPLVQATDADRLTALVRALERFLVELPLRKHAG